MDIVSLLIGLLGVLLGGWAIVDSRKQGKKSEDKIIGAVKGVVDQLTKGIERGVPAPEEEPFDVFVRREVATGLEKGFIEQGFALPASGVSEPHPSWHPGREFCGHCKTDMVPFGNRCSNCGTFLELG